MKRHEALAPLSREHHGALLLAQLLKKDAPAYKGLPGLPGEKLIYAVNFYKANLQQHFIKEEELLLKVKQYHPEIEKLTTEIINEHRQLTHLFNKLDRENNSIGSLDELGNILENHIRKEERVLFPLIQQYCPEEILGTIEL
jgi:iron-sulfur cluster repair protein YtfE (RIC family)